MRLYPGVCTACWPALKIWRGLLRLALGFEPLPGDLGNYANRRQDEKLWWDSWGHDARLPTRGREVTGRAVPQRNER